MPAEEEALQRWGSESALVTLSWYTGRHVFSRVSGSHSREQLPSTRAARRKGGFLSQAQIPQERNFLTQFSISSHSWKQTGEAWGLLGQRGGGGNSPPKRISKMTPCWPCNVPTLSGLSRAIPTCRLKEQMIETSRSFS